MALVVRIWDHKGRLLDLKEAQKILFIGEQECDRLGVRVLPSSSERSDSYLGRSNPG